MSDHWDTRYSQHEAAFGTEPNDFLATAWQHVPRGAGPVVCIGDGQGRNGVFLAEQGFEVISVDLSAVGVEHATRLAARRGVTVTGVVADIADWQPPEGCAAIVSIFCHLASEARARAYPRLTGALASGGVWIMESYTPDQIGRGTGGPPVADMMHDSASIAAELTACGLETVLLHELLRPVVEGPLHTGDAAVVQYVGCRSDRRQEMAS
jgi:SAM-dependent methyltransferase